MAEFETDAGLAGPIGVVLSGLSPQAQSRLAQLLPPPLREAALHRVEDGPDNSRSGMTFVEQVLAAHRQVYAAGESHKIIRLAQRLSKKLETLAPYPACVGELTGAVADDCARRYLDHLAKRDKQALRVTDKMPLNYLHLGLIQLLLPQARVIYCTRDPLDTCLSCYFQNFAGHLPWAYDLDDLGWYYREHDRLMAHWQQVLDLPLLVLSYESLVAEPQRHIRELLEFAHLPWDDNCLSFHQTQRDVATASYDQVRRPIYNTSVGRWHHYEPWLTPLRESLGVIEQRKSA